MKRGSEHGCKGGLHLTGEEASLEDQETGQPFDAEIYLAQVTAMRLRGPQAQSVGSSISRFCAAASARPPPLRVRAGPAARAPSDAP